MTETEAKKTIRSEESMPRQIRVSSGTATVLGLLEGKLGAAPTTAYLMTYNEGKCAANCSFCPQARTSQSKTDQLSRVAWPAYPSQTVIKQLKTTVREGKLRRVCIQTLNYPKVFVEVNAFVKKLKRQTAVPVSVSCQPMTSHNMWLLAEAGADRIGIALDAANESLFDKVKGASAGGPYKWRDVQMLLRVAVGVFGEGNVSTHLMVGLGETEKQMVLAVQECVDMGVLPAMFAFTPIKGTSLADHTQPKLEVYRRLQLARHIIVNGRARAEDMQFDEDGKVVDFGVSKIRLLSIIDSGMPFLTSGCPDCNRPFYNEKPGGPLYNYPRNISAQELKTIKRDLNL